MLQTGSIWNERGVGNETSATLPNSDQRFHGWFHDSDNASVKTVMSFPPMSRVNKNEEFQLSFSGPTHRKELKGNKVKSGENVTANTGHLAHFGRRSSTAYKISLPAAPVQGLSWAKMPDLELTRTRSFSDSQVEDSTRMTEDQLEKLDRLKHQIFEDNAKRKNRRKVSENRVARSTQSDAGFIVLTGKSLKRYPRCHETSAAHQKISSLFDPSSKVVSGGSEAIMQNHDFDVETGDKVTQHTNASDKCDSSLNTEPFTFAYSENSQVSKRKLNGSDLSSAPIGEESDFESISVIMEQLRARSEPGDLASRKISTVQQLRNRSRSETDELKTKVQSFVKKPLPALPPPTLRVKKQVLSKVSSKSGHLKAGANANVSSTPRERKEGEINVHTCPNLNVFSDRSWMYQDESRNRHRYIRGPATPVPPVDYVFSKKKSYRS